MSDFFRNLGPVGDVILNILGALVILVVGYLIARIIASVVRRLLERTNLDDRIAYWLSGGNEQPKYDVEDVLSRGVFWLIMLFVVVAILQQLNLPAVANPINALLQRVTTQYIPSLVGAGILLAVAYLVATALRFLVTRLAEMARIDARLSQHAALEEGEQVKVSTTLATAVFWFVFLLFLPSVLSALGMTEVAAPVQGFFNEAVGYVDNVVGAGIILAIGWFVARIVRQIVSSLLAAVGSDSLGERMGLTGERSLSKLAGMLLYTFILLFVIIAALDELAIEAISGPATAMLNSILNAIPNIFGAAIVLIVSYYIGRLIVNLLVDLMTGIGFDSVPEKLGLPLGGTRTPSQFVGYLIMIGIMLFAAISAAELLGSAALSAILGTFIGFLGQLVLALIIFAIGLYLANLARTVIVGAGGQQAHVTAMLARTAILVLAGAMGLRQLGLADDIVNLAFGILLGAMAIAAALAIGLGSREIAGREVERLVASLRSDSSPDSD